MTTSTFKVIKTTIAIVGVGVNIASTILAEKELDAKIAKAVSKAFTNRK